MILLDTNVLLFAHFAGRPEQPRVAAWLDRNLSEARRLALCWWTVGGFLRISTDPRDFERPFTIEEASSRIGRLLAHARVALLEPGERYWSILEALLARSQVRGALVPDACLAALALENGAKLATTDRDFRRFDGMDLIDPLASLPAPATPAAARRAAR